MERDFEGICFVNLVDYDMLYGHRNDVDGYAKALTYFDERLPEILEKMRDEDILMITADHGCDPSTPSTDHSREYTPLILYGQIHNPLEPCDMLQRPVDGTANRTFTAVALQVGEELIDKSLVYGLYGIV